MLTALQALPCLTGVDSITGIAILALSFERPLRQRRDLKLIKGNKEMTKRNLVLSAAVAMAFGLGATGAQAVSVTTGTLTQVYASELFQGTTPNSVVLTLPVLNVIAGTPLTAGNYVIYLRLSGGAFTSPPNLTSAVAGTVLSSLGTPTTVTSTATYSTAVGSSTADIAAMSVTIFAGQQITAGTVIGTVSAASISNAGSALGAATPTPVTVTATITNAVVNQPAASAVTFTISAANTVDATSTAVNVATSAVGITSTTAAGTNTGQIDLAAASGSATKFNAASNTTTTIQLGTVKFTNGSALVAAGTAYAIAAGDRVNAAVTAPAGFFAPLGTTGVLYLVSGGLTCSTASGAGISVSTAFTTAALAAAATSLTVTGSAVPVTATTYHLCMTVNGTTAIVPGQASAVYTLVKAAGTATDANDVTASQALYALAYNAQVIDVNNFLPAAVTGWSQFYRITNTGSVAAAVNAAFINESTGVVGTSGVVITSLAAGASSTVTGAAIEAVAGTQTSAARPRVRFTAATNGMKVTNILFTPNGSFTNNSAEQ